MTLIIQGTGDLALGLDHEGTFASIVTLSRQQLKTDPPLGEHALGFRRADLVEPAPVTVEELELQLDLGIAGGHDGEALGLGGRVRRSRNEFVGLDFEDSGEERHGALAGIAQT